MNNICLTHPSGAEAQVMEYAAHVLSWRTSDGIERLFLSNRTEFKPGVAIRGGVPIIFPQFSALGPYPRHGFARTQAWQLQPGASPESAVFMLRDNELTCNQWPFRFSAEYRVTVLADALHMELAIANQDEKPWSFTAALHTYLRVADIAHVRVSGLEGLMYRNSANHDCMEQQTQELLSIEGEVDRIYFDTLRPIDVVEGPSRLRCSAQGFTDTVVWNPGPAKTAGLADMDADGYRRMLCVEAAAIKHPVVLQPGERWCGSQQLQVIR